MDVRDIVIFKTFILHNKIQRVLKIQIFFIFLKMEKDNNNLYNNRNQEQENKEEEHENGKEYF